MVSLPRLHALRLSLERLAVERLRAHRLYAPPMQAFLAAPLPERLSLLTKVDGADAKTIKSLLGVTDQDLALESDRMIPAAKLLTAAMDEPWDFIPDGDLDTQLGQLVFRYLPAVLIG